MKALLNNKRYLPFPALLCALLWALAYPLIKFGYRELGIASDDIGSKILFAGIRFLAAGLFVLIFFCRKKQRLRLSGNTCRWLALYALVNTFLHYLFSYIGLGYIQGSRGVILDSLGSFLLILLSCMIFADDSMSIMKALGCLVGFGAILLMNVSRGTGLFADISFLGDGMILLNSACAAFGGIIGRIVSRKTDMTRATGLSMAAGGALLCLIGGIVRPAVLWHLTPSGVGVLLALILISAVCFSIYNQLLANHPISRAAIYNGFIPIFGVIFSCLILGEPLRIRYLTAGIMAAAGIILVNRETPAAK